MTLKEPKTLTADDITPAVKAAVRAYLLARVHAEVMRAAVDKIQREILAECPLSDGFAIEHGLPHEPITDPKDAYNCTDEAESADYYAECNKRLRAAGLKPPEMPDTHCPALVAEHLQVQTTWLIEEAAAEMLDLGIDGKELNGRLLCLGLETRQKFLDTIVGLIVNLPDFQSPLPLKDGV